MTLQQFIDGDFLKYAIISREAYEGDDLAQSISSHPRSIGSDHIALSIEPKQLAGFAEHVESLGLEFEFEFNIGSNKVSLLTRTQALALVAEYDEDEIL